MFEIYNSENQHFTQWEQNHVLTNPCMKAKDEVVFRNSSGKTIVAYARTQGGQVVVDVPNVLLQYPLNILVGLGQGLEQHSECETVFSVVEADKPEDYEFVDNIKLPSNDISLDDLEISWNDLTDKPFGVIAGEDVFLPQDTRLTYSTQTQSFMGNVIAAPSVGTICTVTYNGVCYEVIAKEFMQGQIALGNLAMAGLEDTGEPFAVIINPDTSTVMVAPLDGATELVIEIKGQVEYTNKLDTKFYEAPCIYYADNTGASVNYLYSDVALTSKLTLSEFLLARKKNIIIMHGSGQYFPVGVCFTEDYGYADIAMNGIATDAMVIRRIHTAEYNA